MQDFQGPVKTPQSSSSSSAAAAAVNRPVICVLSVTAHSDPSFQDRIMKPAVNEVFQAMSR